MKGFWYGVKEFFSPFELLYLSIALATFEHSVWASAYLFEGSASEGTVWFYLKGWLIAIAVDLGMLLISRFLQDANDLSQIVVLVISFLLAAVSSFYLQMVYILAHTPTFVVSSGVSAYWANSFLINLLDARVLLLPLALPVLASSYTIARIYNKKQVKKQESQEVVIRTNGNPHEDLMTLIEAVSMAPLELPDGKRVIETETGRVDLEALVFATDLDERMAHGPYSSRKGMLMAMKRLATKNLLPAKIENPNE